MSNILWKNFHLCFSKCIKRPPSTVPHHPSPPQEDDHSRRPLLLKNSQYDGAAASSSNFTDDPFSSSGSSSAASSSDAPPPPPPRDIAAALASQRFFFSSPGRSNSIFDGHYPPPSSPGAAVFGGGVAVPTDSPDPFADFRLSMQEMVEARGDGGGQSPPSAVDWEYLQELLLCYLSLNHQHNHKFIVGAFADLLASLVSPTAAATCQLVGPNGRCQLRHINRHLGKDNAR